MSGYIEKLIGSIYHDVTCFEPMRTESRKTTESNKLNNMTTNEMQYLLDNTIQPYVLMLIGPPVSGKDTLLRKMDLENAHMISRDDILMSLHNTDNYADAFQTADQKLVDRILNEQIQENIDKKRSVIINMTNLTKRSRNKHLSKFPSKLYTKIAVVFPRLQLSEYEVRNNVREKEINKSIPMTVINDMLNKWESVTSDEGFDIIINL